jgi:hypothetical protein
VNSKGAFYLFPEHLEARPQIDRLLRQIARTGKSGGRAGHRLWRRRLHPDQLRHQPRQHRERASSGWTALPAPWVDPSIQLPDRPWKAPRADPRLRAPGWLTSLSSASHSSKKQQTESQDTEPSSWMHGATVLPRTGSDKRRPDRPPAKGYSCPGRFQPSRISSSSSLAAIPRK